MESAESINTIAVVLFQTGLHKLQEPRLLCVLYCQRGKSRVIFGKKKKNQIIQKYFHNSRGTDSSCRKTPNIQIHWDRSLDKRCYQNKLLRSTSLTLEEEQTARKLLALEECVEK